MSALPTRLRVGPWWYEVVTDHARIRDFEHHTVNRDVHGGCLNDQLVILVDTNYPPGQQRDTLWHEVKHAVNYLVAFGGEDKLDEEEVVSRTCGLELMVLRDNPGLVAFLVAPDAAPGEAA